MREDAKKILYQGRCGGDRDVRRRERRKTKRANANGEDLPNKQSMKPRNEGYDTRKEQRFHYTFLQRFLSSRVGQSWDSVYSELRKAFTPDAWETAKRYLDVCTKVQGFDGDTPLSYEFRKHNKDTHATETFYVHPETRILCRNPNDWRSRSHGWKRVKKIRDYIIKDKTRPDVWYIRYDGIWYECEMKLDVSSKLWWLWRDTIFRGEDSTRIDFYGGNHYAVTKRAMNSREIKKLKKNNNAG